MRWTAIVLGMSAALASVPGARAETVCTVLADAANGVVLVADGDCTRRVPPASTFKIAISLMGYDSGFLKDEHTPALPFHDGYADWSPAWRQTTDPARWMSYSVVWYSQQVTRALGMASFQRYVREFDYGNRDVSGDPGRRNGLIRAWLWSSLRISPLEQVAFLQKLVNRQLPVGARATDMTMRITALPPLPGGWQLHGKTGTAVPREGSPGGTSAFGWFVGWAGKGDRTVVFARLVRDDKPGAVSAGVRARDALVADLPSLLETPYN